MGHLREILSLNNQVPGQHGGSEAYRHFGGVEPVYVSEDTVLCLSPGVAAAVTFAKVGLLCDILLDGERTRPVIIVSALGREWPTDVKVLAARMQGVADVVAIVDPAACYVIRDRCGIQFSCHSGYVRLVPPVGNMGNSQGFPSFSPAAMDRLGQERFLETLAAVSSAAGRAKSGSPTRKGCKARAEAAAPKEGPASMAEAVETAAKEAEFLDFLPSAARGAQASPYQWPDRALDALRKLDEAAGNLSRKGGRGKAALREELRALGMLPRYRNDLSVTAHGMYGDDYTFMWKGTRHVFGQHLAYGVGMSRDKRFCICFEFDTETSRFVIAHVGNSGRNTRSS